MQQFKFKWLRLWDLLCFNSIALAIGDSVGKFCFRIGLHVKSRKENYVDDGVEAVIVFVVRRIALLSGHKVDRVEKENDELADLNLSQISLPPEVWLHLRTERSHRIIAVHRLYKNK